MSILQKHKTSGLKSDGLGAEACSSVVGQMFYVDKHGRNKRQNETGAANESHSSFPIEEKMSVNTI